MSTSLAFLFGDWIRFLRKKSRAGFGSIGAGRCRQPPTLPFYYEGKVERLFFPRLRVRMKDNSNSPRGKFHRFLFPFSTKTQT